MAMKEATRHRRPLRVLVGQVTFLGLLVYEWHYPLLVRAEEECCLLGGDSLFGAGGSPVYKYYKYFNYLCFDCHLPATLPLERSKSPYPSATWPIFVFPAPPPFPPLKFQSIQSEDEFKCSNHHPIKYRGLNN